jgi:hypothetical protein
MRKIKPLKERICPVCREMYTPKRYGLRLTRCCDNAGCRLGYAQGVRAKEAEKAARSRKKAFLDDDKAFQRAKAQKAFNEFIRLRDASLGCVSCDKPATWSGQWHAGHYKTTGARPDLRFNEDNCHKQCSVCNNHLSGNLGNYRASLYQKIGLDRFADLEFDPQEPKKFTAADYKNIHATYAGKVKELKSARQ